MTRVCLVGDADVTLRYELLSRETAREALQTYDLREPFRNSVGLETVSLGAAVSLLNDLNWYLVRFVDDALVLEPSVSETEWLSRDLATAVRDDEVEPDETDRFLKVYGVEQPESGFEEDEDSGPPGADDADESEQGDTTAETGDMADESSPDPAGPPRLVEPMLVTRTGETIPEYDLRNVEETLVVRVTESEFGS